MPLKVRTNNQKDSIISERAPAALSPPKASYFRGSSSIYPSAEVSTQLTLKERMENCCKRALQALVNIINSLFSCCGKNPLITYQPHYIIAIQPQPSKKIDPVTPSPILPEPIPTPPIKITKAAKVIKPSTTHQTAKVRSLDLFPSHSSKKIQLKPSNSLHAGPVRSEPPIIPQRDPVRLEPAVLPLAAPGRLEKRKWHDFPDPLITHTMSYLDFQELRNLETVNKRLGTLSNNNVLWKNLYEKWFDTTFTDLHSKIRFRERLKRYKNSTEIREVANCRELISLYPRWSLVKRSWPINISKEAHSIKYSVITTIGDMKERISSISGIPKDRIGLRLQNVDDGYHYWSNIENSDHDEVLIKEVLPNSLAPTVHTPPEIGHRIGYYRLSDNE